MLDKAFFKLIGRTLNPCCLWLSLALFCLVTPFARAQAINITGDYSGVLNQPGGPVVPTFTFSMLLFEDANGNVTGDSFANVPGEPYFVVESLSGTIANGIFNFQETSIVAQNPAPGTYYCIKSGQLTISADGSSLTGPWTAPGCVPGTISINISISQLLGNAAGMPGGCSCGDPISLGNGNLFESASDYSTFGQNALSFTRYYNSLANSNTFASALGGNWRSNFQRYLRVLSSSRVIAERADGQQLLFTQQGGQWATDTDIDVSLTQSGSLWTLTDANDAIETYSTASAGEALLETIQTRNGYTQTLHYGTGNQLTSVSDSYGRMLLFTYQNNLLNTLTTPDGLVVTYGYTSSGYTPGTLDRLSTVEYSTTPSSIVSYLYENSSLPFALTGITDEDGNRYATWTYDAMGRALTSQHGGGADLTSVAYNDSNGQRTLTNALGQQSIYTFTTLQGIPKLTAVARQATTSTAAASESFSYDSNGYLSSRTDWNGNQTTFVNNLHGLPTSISEAVGTSATRTTSITYDSTWVHLPSLISSDGVDISYTYDGSGEPLTKTLTDTTTTTTPYSTKGQSRTWTNTWSDFLLASTQTPNGNTTSFGYDGTGALTSITDPLKHVTNITAHSGGGLPDTVVDPNGVTTNLVYDGRQRRISSTVSGTTGTYKTSWAFDLAGNLLTTTLPDGSFLTNSYDTAHRLIKTTDALGNYISYTLNALGDRTASDIYQNGGTLTRQRSGTFDALGRELVDTGGAGQTTTRTFDPNGNVLTVEDGLNHITTNTYDALNRLSQSTDANSGTTTPVYDTHNRVISVTDANGNATLYTRNGFGDVIQQTSPDSGISVFRYDSDANLAGKTDALGIVTNQTFDALDRPLTTTYPAHAAENVAYTYDQTGSGFSFGIGRLTSVTDAAGSLTRTYEERGNLLSEVRVNGTTTLTTGYTYDGASRIANMTYPDGTLVTYQHDVAGYVSTVTAKLPGASTATTLATLTHQPFGPLSVVTYGNGIAENWAFDNSYRPTSITDTLSGAPVQNLAYGYDLANNVKSITDAVTAANTQTFGYDSINRLISAASATGGYGSYAWTYDKVGNRLTQILNGTSTAYGYTSGTNRLATITITPPQAKLESPNTIKRFTPAKPEFSSGSTSTGSLVASSNQRTKPHPSRSTMLAGVLGWPMLLVGFAGVLGFRRRLLSHHLLAALAIFAILTGGAIVLNGCGGGGGGTVTMQTAATPTFSPGTGTYTGSQTITISDTTAGAAIYFTSDRTTPTASSTHYTGPITVSSTETVSAIAIASGYTNSAVATATYTINIPMVATPTFSPVAGTYSSPQTVSISDTTAGASIYFTTDGTTPTASSTLYSAPITVANTETVSAIAVVSGDTNSAVATATYTINIPTVATPTFSPGSGTYTSTQTVTISDTTAGAAILFTTDGTTPTTSSTVYSTPISVSTSETIQAIATAPGATTSAVGSATYTINNPNNVSIITNANGNITSIPPTNSSAYATFAYNNANRLVSITGSPMAATFVYDWEGQRFSKTNNGSQPEVYSYSQDSHLIANNDNGTVTDYIYVDGRPLAILQPGAANAANQVNYVLADRLGTPQQVTNNATTPASVWSTTYAPFGTTGTITASLDVGLRFPGQYADPETGFSYNLNRDYMPNLGRYLQTDPIGVIGGANTYIYASNSPITLIDPQGLCFVGNEGFCDRSNLYSTLAADPSIASTTNFFSAASNVTNALAGLISAPAIFTDLSDQEDQFLSILSACLEVSNLSSAEQILNGNLYANTSISQNDLSFVTSEQTQVQAALDGLSASNPILYNSLIYDINANLNGWSRHWDFFGDLTFETALDKTIIQLGRPINFGNINDRILLGLNEISPYF
ncbi:MAG TPA: chitobiase/beta-hexosaminidase C-terminal domain-containing protein [Candidatus Binataceae bacterium]|nr:chitobiase/beta-hexosaminidase C-terminal domain-containing protein [Candidatus Binataceae bacterium]